MKQKYKHLTAFCAALMLLAGNGSAQTGCAISNTTNLHDYGCQIGDQIDYFQLDGFSNRHDDTASFGLSSSSSRLKI